MDAPMINIEGSPSGHTAVNTAAMAAAIAEIFLAARDTHMDQKTVRDALALLRGTTAPTPVINVKECTFTTAPAPVPITFERTGIEHNLTGIHDVTEHGVSESNTPRQNWEALQAMIDALNPGGLSVKGERNG